MNILGNKVVLRAIEEEDLILLHKWANDPQTQDIMGPIHFPSSMDFHKSWFQNLKNDQTNLRFAVETNEFGLIGIASIMGIDLRHKHASPGITIGNNESKGKGYGVDSVMTIMRFCFDELNLERLDGLPIEYNEISISMLLNKCGWKKEGIKSNYYYRKGRFWDAIIIGITRQNYYELVEKTGYWTLQNS